MIPNAASRIVYLRLFLPPAAVPAGGIRYLSFVFAVFHTPQLTLIECPVGLKRNSLWHLLQQFFILDLGVSSKV